MDREGTHSVWQLVNHIVFWQDYTLRVARGERPARERFMTSYRAMVALINTGDAAERPLYHLMHESYHFGQIMYLRAMQGFEPIE